MVKSVVANPSYTPVVHPAQPFRTFDDFYPFYLGEHSRRINRIFHLTGTSIALACHTRVLLSLVPYITRQLSLLHVAVGPQTLDILRKLQLSRGDALKIALGGLVQGYFFAWVGHFFVEHNKPATFKVSVMGV
ncbi:hypothetical protein QFC24_006055 [Naganishia onofrii]|uniref:Uncharacterized protein n=1 Tax=Naganishia onofrii TaxID=1851511 RepID=A0ACC2X722_9TREE|nr:hypothetical protein QFC24_006055 [Naganishia onofrii]